MLDFEHIGLAPAIDCFEICSAGWDHCLGSLQRQVESRKGVPFQSVVAAMEG